MSLTLVVAKVFERIVWAGVLELLKVTNFFEPTQHGTLNHWTGILDESDRNQVDVVVYLDFQKAFDKVPHERLY